MILTSAVPDPTQLSAATIQRRPHPCRIWGTIWMMISLADTSPSSHQATSVGRIISPLDAPIATQPDTWVHLVNDLRGLLLAYAFSSACGKAPGGRRTAMRMDPAANQRPPAEAESPSLHR